MKKDITKNVTSSVAANQINRIKRESFCENSFSLLLESAKNLDIYLKRRMGEILLRNQSTSIRFFVRILYIMAITTSCYAFPAAHEDEADREYPPWGAHQLATFILSQLRRADFPSLPSPDVPILPYRIPHSGKRNSAELTSSIMDLVVKFKKKFGQFRETYG
ncbi:hypothetical protein QE152_g12934 [Popillia japonica]|uniref:Uncharacterized protein n=1 Tax=Popillia japonica TaxID=7064 RepID=A0AAW1LFQ7_POPJA